jgi:hypothetical protein
MGLLMTQTMNIGDLVTRDWMIAGSRFKSQIHQSQLTNHQWLSLSYA